MMGAVNKEYVLKTGRDCTWKEIEVGEVFAWKGCWCIFYKVDNNFTLHLTDDDSPCFSDVFDRHGSLSPWSSCWFDKNIYKLSKSIQRLWKEE